MVRIVARPWAAKEFVVLFSVEARGFLFLQHIQTVSRFLFASGKVARACSYNSPPFSAQLRKCVDIPPLPHVLLWHEQGLILIFIYLETYISMPRTNQLVNNYFLFGE
jgi:hypothetical protein